MSTSTVVQGPSGTRVEVTELRQYVSWTLVALAYAVAFFQRVAPQAIAVDLTGDFGMDAAGLGILASAYFYGYTLMQIPAGLLVDRWGVRIVVLASLAVSSAGTALLAGTSSPHVAFLSRVLVACGDALVFTALLKLVALNFADKKFGLMSGLSQVSGYIGGIVATTPLAAASTQWGWRFCFVAVAALTAVNLIASSLYLPAARRTGPSKTLGAIVNSLGGLLRRHESWGCALTFASHFVVVTSLAGVWAPEMLMDNLHVDRIPASTPVFGFMLASVVGSIWFGYAADKHEDLTGPLLLNCGLRVLLLAAMSPSLLGSLNLPTSIALFCALGFVAGGTVPLVLKSVKRIYSPALIGSGASMNTTFAGATAALLQPLLGWILVTTRISPDAGNSAFGYNLLLIAFILVSAVGALGTILMAPSRNVQAIQPIT